VPPRPAQGAPSNDKISEPVDHGVGRSRGGLTTKIHALVDGGVRPVALLLSPGQAGDNPRLVPLLGTLAQAGHRPAHLLGDKTSHAVKLSSGDFARGDGGWRERGVLVVDLVGVEAVMQAAQ